MTLGELIEQLERLPPDMIFGDGFDEAFSYRGFYDQLAFSPANNTRADMMLAIAKGAVGQTYTGYKGGEYTMLEHTPVNIAEWGSYGGDEDALTMWRWKYMLSTTTRKTNSVSESSS